MTEKTKEKSFEQAYKRLEEILEKINQSEVSLDDSLNLYKEADSLINNCSKKLDSAEKKITSLMKNRENDLVLDENGNPVQTDFSSEKGTNL